jgi:uncharacterized protein YcbX
VDAPVEAGTHLGRVAAIWRHPVKSMAPEPLEATDVTWHGVAGDRRWAFARDGDHGGFPWQTIRQRPDMVLYRPRLAEPGRPDASPVVVTTPGGAELAVTDPALAAELAGPDAAVRAVKLDRGTFDAAPLSLVTTRSLAGLGHLVGMPVAAGRFRPNLLVDTGPEAGSGGGFPEDGWVGCVLAVGGMRVRLDRRDRRCLVIDVDPLTGERGPAVLRAVARQRQSRFGVYGAVVAPGTVTVGDPVTVVGTRLMAGTPGGAL